MCICYETHFYFNFFIHFISLKSAYSVSEGYKIESTKEHNIINFYKNDKRIDSVDIWNPNDDDFDKKGSASTDTPELKIKIIVEFDIYGHIDLDQIDSCIKEAKKKAPKDIVFQGTITHIKTFEVICYV